MSWRVVSNSTMLRVNSFKCSSDARNGKKALRANGVYRRKESPYSDANLNEKATKDREGLSPELVKYIEGIFLALDPSQQGNLRWQALANYWEASETGYRLLWLTRKHGIEHTMVLSVLKEIAPANGLISIGLFLHAVKFVLGKAQRCDEEMRGLVRRYSNSDGKETHNTENQVRRGDVQGVEVRRGDVQGGEARRGDVQGVEARRGDIQ